MENIFLDEPKYLFHQGTNFHAYEFMGVTLNVSDGKYIYTFRTWAPNAFCVELVSDFCGWETPIKMNRLSSGIWETEYISENSLVGSAYKYKITGKNGTHLKGDPYAKYSKGAADGASVIYESNFLWSDKSWFKGQEKEKKSDSYLSYPINIYEIHLGSFLKKKNGEYLSYREIADILPT